MITTFIPYDTDKNLVKAYSNCMDKVPENEWALFIDRDVMILYPDYVHILEEKIKQYPNAVMFTCKTNRIGHPLQKAIVDTKSNDINYHVEKARLHRNFKGKPINVTGELLSGFFMLIKKSAWNNIELTTNGMLGVDNEIFKKMSKQGEVLLLQDFYVYHWYRNNNKKDISHLL